MEPHLYILEDKSFLYIDEMYIYTSIQTFEDGHNLQTIVAVFSSLGGNEPGLTGVSEGLNNKQHSRCEYLHSDLVMQRTLTREEWLSIRYTEISHDHFSKTGSPVLPYLIPCYTTSIPRPCVRTLHQRNALGWNFILAMTKVVRGIYFCLSSTKYNGTRHKIELELNCQFDQRRFLTQTASDIKYRPY
jgi:hypothetical protein